MRKLFSRLVATSFALIPMAGFAQQGLQPVNGLNCVNGVCTIPTNGAQNCAGGQCSPVSNGGMQCGPNGCFPTTQPVPGMQYPGGGLNTGVPFFNTGWGTAQPAPVAGAGNFNLLPSPNGQPRYRNPPGGDRRSVPPFNGQRDRLQQTPPPGRFPAAIPR